MTEPVRDLKRRVEVLELERTTYRQVTVTAVHKTTSTYDGDVEGVGLVEGFQAPAHFLPQVGDVVRLPLNGAVPGFEPGRIAEGAIGEDELAGYVTENITTAMETADGKNTVSFSTDPATAATPGSKAGDLWFQKDVFGLGQIVGTWEWTGTAWSPRVFHDNVLSSLTVGKLVGGTGTFDLIVGGRLTTANTGQRTELNPLGLQAFNAAGTLTVNINGVTNLLTGEVRTGASGTRHVRVGGAGNESSVRLLAPDGTTSFMRSSSETGIGGEGLQLGLTIAGAPTKWNSIFLTQQEWASYHSKIHDMVYQDRWAVAQTVNRGAASGYRLILDTGQLSIRGGDLGTTDRYWSYNLFNGNVEHRFATGAKVLWETGGTTESPKLNLLAPSGFGALLKAVDSGGTFFEVRNIFDNGFIATRAAAFEVNSDARGKSAIVDVPIPSALAQLDTIKARKFRRNHSGDLPVLDKDGRMVDVIAQDGPEEVGVIAQEMPEFVRSGTASEVNIDLVRWLLLLTASVQELNMKVAK